MSRLRPREDTWLGSDRLLARLVGRPVATFLAVEAAGGVLLLVATAAALAWANSPWQESYADLWHTDLTIAIGGASVSEDLQHWINDALMAVFFFVVGLEIKRELVVGELKSRRDAALPAVAALGGMVVPAVVYAAWTIGRDGAEGWGIPMATDIAFAVGVLTLVSRRVPPAVRVMLLSLAIVDDIGAILVIAVFYTGDLSLAWLGAAAGGLVLVVAARRARVWYVPVYSVLGAAVWFATYQSGIHATIAGVVLGLITPARPLIPYGEAERIADELEAVPDVTAHSIRAASFRLQESVSVAERLEERLHPWTSYVVIPLFALANAGVTLSTDGLRGAAASPVTLGIVTGLVLGKLVGVGLATWVAVRLGFGRLPPGVSWRHVWGMAGLAGIGFTVSLFIAGLAFDDPAINDEAKIGILAASVVAAIVGSLLLRSADRGPSGPPPVP
jgi:NhaA family Na+:H+ antiporter